MSIDHAIMSLVDALAESKGWLRGYAESIVRDAIDRRDGGQAVAGETVTDEQIDALLPAPSWPRSIGTDSWTLDEVRPVVRAALALAAGARAQPAEHLTVTTDREGRCVLVSWQDDEHGILRVVWEADGPYTPHESSRGRAAQPVAAEGRFRAALEDIAAMTYDAWSNGARAGEIARAALSGSAESKKGEGIAASQDSAKGGKPVAWIANGDLDLLRYGMHAIAGKKTAVDDIGLYLATSQDKGGKIE